MTHTVAQNLKTLIPAHGGQCAVAKKAGISRNTLSNALKGAKVKASKLKVIAEACGITLEELTAEPSRTNSKPSHDHQPQRVWWTSSETARINLHMVARRYGVPPVTVLECAPIFFAILAEASLGERTRRLAEVEARLKLVYSDELCERVPELRHGAFRAEESLWVEERSIEARDIDGRVEDPKHPGDGSSPFVRFLSSKLSEYGLAETAPHDEDTTDTFARGVALFEEELLAVHGGNDRARYAVQSKPSILGMIPKELAWTEGEGEERAARRHDWLASQISDATWQAHEEEMQKLYEQLGDV